MAQDCMRLAALIAARDEPSLPVLVSLARAGTPVGGGVATYFAVIINSRLPIFQFPLSATVASIPTRWSISCSKVLHLNKWCLLMAGRGKG